MTTIATYGDVVEANLARSLLESADIRAFLADEGTVGLAWHLTTALGGVKLQVADEDAKKAAAALFAQRDHHLNESETDDLLQGAGDDRTHRVAGGDDRRAGNEQAVDDLPEPDSHASEFPDTVAETEPTLRELTAVRALRGAILGILLFPIQFYVFWLLLKIFVSEERLDPAPRRKAFVAALINVPFIVITPFAAKFLLPAR